MSICFLYGAGMSGDMPSSFLRERLIRAELIIYPSGYFGGNRGKGNV